MIRIHYSPTNLIAKRLVFLFTVLLAFPTTAAATNYYVNNTVACNNSNAGTSPAEPWCTLGKAASTLVAGDAAIVGPGGSYDERVSPVNSGTAANPIAYSAASGTKPKVRGFTLIGKQYITINGFDLTNAGFAADAIATFLVTATVGIKIQNNSIHDTTGSAFRVDVFAPGAERARKLHIQGNTITNIGPLGNRQVVALLWVDDLLVEQNDISHGDDFFRIFGFRNVLRNNEIHDAYLREQGAGQHHIDFVQTFCAPMPPDVASFLLLEGNSYHDAPDTDEHFVTNNATVGCSTPSSTIISRYNVIGPRISVGYLGDTTRSSPSLADHHKFYNNTTVKGTATGSGGYSSIFTGSTTASVLNNIFVDAVTSSSTPGLYLLRPGDPTSTGNYNLAYKTTSCGGPCTWSNPINSEPNRLLNLDPKFLSFSGGDYRLQAGSPAINSGGPLTTVAAGDRGSGATLVVTDAAFFQDGWGGASADWIAVGTTGNTVQISSINYSTNTITLARPITRSPRQPVWLFKNSSGVQVLYGAAPDRGAFEFVE